MTSVTGARCSGFGSDSATASLHGLPPPSASFSPAFFRPGFRLAGGVMGGVGNTVRLSRCAGFRALQHHRVMVRLCSAKRVLDKPLVTKHCIPALPQTNVHCIALDV
jgi:hypothetical protein